MEELLKEIKYNQLKFLRELEQMKRIQDMMFVIICGKKAKELQLYKRYIDELDGFDDLRP